MFACEHEGIVPDLIAMAKGIAGGLPMGAVTGRAEIMDAIHVGGLGTTFGGNPIACAAALAAIETIEVDGLVARAHHIESIIRPHLDDLAERYALVGDVRGRGAMQALEVVRPGDEPDPAATQEITRRCHAEGVIVLTCGTYGNVIRLLPPLVIDDMLLTDGLDVLERAVDAVATG
jgi:4-aminobutyrate aminotransferase/(S)-3-amino-2-methylpropionate transaminase